MKNRSERRKHCALAVVRWSRKFSLRRCRPPSRGAGRPKFNQLEMVTTFTYKPSLVKNRCMQFRVIVVTDPHLPPARPSVANTQTGPMSLARSVKRIAHAAEYGGTTQESIVYITLQRSRRDAQISAI